MIKFKLIRKHLNLPLRSFALHSQEASLTLDCWRAFL